MHRIQIRRKGGYTKAIAKTGAVTLIQCFGGALNLNIHYHLLFLVGIILKETGRKTGLSGYCMTLDFSKNSFYSSYTWPSSLFICEGVCRFL